MIIRVKYKKGEEVKYVGHLDAMRTFTKCLKRTNIPLEYSKGFNPRIQISFALPLGVGVTSDLDYFDLTLSSKMNVDLFLSELNSVLPLGFKVLDAKYIEDKKSLMSLVKEAIYEITLKTNIEKTAIKSLLDEEKIVIIKESKSKKKAEEIDIKPYIIQYEVSKLDNENIVLKIHSTAGSVNNLNPIHLINLLSEKLGTIEDYEIKREQLILA